MGKRTWLEKDLRDRWIPMLAQLTDTPEGHRQSDKLCEEIRDSWAERGAQELNQQQSLMDQVRLAIKQTLGMDHFSLNWIKFSTAEYTRLNNQKQDRVGERNEAIQFIDNPDAIVQKAVELLESPEWSEVCAGLAVLTGRRSSELLSTARFEKCSQWSVTFTGALKRRGELQELSFEIPTLTTADRVVKALEKVRSHLPEALELSAEGVNRRYGQAVMRACDKHFAGLVPLREGKDNLYTHLFRAIYATISTFWYCPPQVNETEFKAAIQGHYAILDASDSTLRRELAASRHYSDYEMADSVIEQYQGKRKGIKLGLGGVKPLEVFEGAIVQSATPIKAEPKHRSSLRIWREDYDSLTQVLDRFEGKTQQDKVAAWIEWSLEQWQSQGIEEVEREPIPQRQEAEVIQSEAIQSEAIQSEVMPTPLETKIDSLVDAIAQLVNLQTQVLTAPTAIAPTSASAPPTRQMASVPKPATEGKKEEQATRKYRPRGQNQELIDQAIHAIMQHNDQAQTHDDKWAITINGLKGLGIKSQHAITRGLEERKGEIEAHHHKHQIDPTKHNLRHRGKTKIQQVIVLD